MGWLRYADEVGDRESADVLEVDLKMILFGKCASAFCLSFFRGRFVAQRFSTRLTRPEIDPWTVALIV